MTWDEAENQTDAAGNPTKLALALQALYSDTRCDCDDADGGTFLACRCEVALRELFDANAALQERCMAMDGALQRVRERVNRLLDDQWSELPLDEYDEGYHFGMARVLVILDEEVPR